MKSVYGDENRVMNINKYQQTQFPGLVQAGNLQAQQVLLQQLQQGQQQGQQQQAPQGQQQQPPQGQQQQQQQLFAQQGPLPGSYSDNLGQSGYQNGGYQNTFQRSMQQQQQQQQQQFYAQQQFQQQPNQQNQPQTQSQGALQPGQNPMLFQPQYQGNQQGQMLPPPQQQQQQQQQQQLFGQSILPHPQQQQTQQQQPSLANVVSGQKFSLAIEKPNSIYWQHQVQLCQMSRGATTPHYYARQYASNSRKGKNPYSNEVKAVTLVDATKSMLVMLEEQEKANGNGNNVDTPPVNNALLFNKKLALELDDEHLQEEQRMRQKTQGKQLWCQLDLCGQGLTNIAPKLFLYDFLESLYLNNNKLTSVPPIISKLRGLRTLDLSQNRISELPSALGLCFNLRYLYLFDNNIRSLPKEFGNLIELLFLGIEGNPIDSNIANLIADKGTKGLISYIRDSKIDSIHPNPRLWYQVEEDGEIVEPATEDIQIGDVKGESFTLMSYNTLCHHYATPKLYKYTPSWALDWEYRRNKLKEDVLKYKTDIVCMQEVETKTYHDFWVPLMLQFGYKGVFYSKTRSKTMSEVDSKKVDGCATFYKSDKFSLLQKQNFEYNSVCMGSDKYKKTEDLFNRFMNKDNVALITFLQHTSSGEKIMVVNTHLHWDPAFNDVKTLQVGILLEELHGILKKFHHTHADDDVKGLSLIICGDFNSIRGSAVYQLFSSGTVHKHQDLEGRDYGRFTETGFQHPFKLKSAYDNMEELPFTNFSPGFTDVIDYIWYSTNSLQVRGLLGKVDMDYVNHCIGFPNADFPSDHIPLVTNFAIRQSTTHKKPDFKPEFKSGGSRKT
ncbi:Glucose-repressible alcohol dehydrogenase transcriptional effector [Scheffersomyces spartinae]|uniref:CCR4-Not complex 3'-5'-exoribonuclease subunit Ccr4 n=1 Tax=Scheffersomyces spartinae TaxID=45513 RepID=A0A9P7VBZ7_9ASCO|nr:Glucose-repressible alcohol dehydrogenase transcriptional effector [Scheffersomyces spartinae]KAG7195003.1 Glucose-repressible alcohol dehydrogenase transcriptional effector [Scheffersomyces spartinae]